MTEARPAVVTLFRTAAVLLAVTVLMGSMVAATESGAACPTWPGCYPGQFGPRFHLNPLVEFTHRVIAGIALLTCLAAGTVGLRDPAVDGMNIMHRRNHFPQQLSGGQQQRVAIARAVVANPKVILADEPTGNLDSTNGLEVMNLLTQLNQGGTTIIMVTHSPHDAGFAHRIVNLFDGKVVTENFHV